MKNIRFSRHAELKLGIMKTHGISLNKELIEKTVMNPDKIEKGYGKRWIAQGSLDDKHVIRVVYEVENDDINNYNRLSWKEKQV